MDHAHTKQHLLGILARVRDWYVFPPQVREEYYPDFREAINELIVEGRAEQTQIDGKTYYRVRGSKDVAPSIVSGPLLHGEVEEPCSP